MRTMVRSLTVIEKEKSKLDKKFEETLKLWNTKNIEI